MGAGSWVGVGGGLGLGLAGAGAGARKLFWANGPGLRTAGQ